MEELPCSSGVLINHGFRKLCGALPFGGSRRSSHPTLVVGHAPGCWQRWSRCPALPHGAGLSPSACLALTTAEKPGLTIRRTHFGVCNQLCHELRLSLLQSEGTLRNTSEARAGGTAAAFTLMMQLLTLQSNYQGLKFQ